MRSAGAARGSGRGHRRRRFLEIVVGGRDHSRSLTRRVELRQRGEEPQEGGRAEHADADHEPKVAFVVGAGISDNFNVKVVRVFGPYRLGDRAPLALDTENGKTTFIRNLPMLDPSVTVARGRL